MSKIKMYGLRKIKIQQLIENDFKLSISTEEEDKYIIKQQESPLFRQMNILRNSKDSFMDELILVEAKHDKKREEKLKHILNKGFIYNDRRFVRYGKSASQAKDGITLFIEEKYYEEMMNRSQLDLEIKDVVISKYESYRNLILSACQSVEKKIPRIVIVDEFEKDIHNQHIRYAEETDVTFPDKKTKKPITITKREIKEGYKDISISPFDGFGVHSKKITKMINENLKLSDDTVLYQIRMPFMKGVSVEMNFHRFYSERDVTEIRDVFGKVHKVKDIDCIWNTSMWKGFKYFKEAYGNNAWDKYIEKVNKYKFQLGVSKYNHHMNEIDHYSRLNFQYLQCLNLDNPNYFNKFNDKDNEYDILDENNWGKMINVAKYSTDLMEKIIKGNKLHTLKFLGKNHSESETEVKSNYVKAILANDRMMKDPSIKKMLKNKLDKTINEMKFGKIYAKGFYHTVIGDVIGYLEYAAGLEVKGCLSAGEFHANSLEDGYCLSMRSPLVDPSEVNKVKLVHNEYTNKYLRHLYKKDICMINMYDLTQQQQGGMDQDGDAVFLCNDQILLDSKIDMPIVVDINDKATTDKVPYTPDNITKYECRSRDNRIGEITNVATSILNSHTTDEKWKKINEDNIAWLRLAQGKEIDYLKTGTRWVIPNYLRKHMEKLPYFLLYNYPKKLHKYRKISKANRGLEEKIQYNAYRSPSPMNELCDYICQWEKRNIDWDNSLINNCDIVVDQSLDLADKVIMKRITSVYDKYLIELKKELDKKDGNKNVDKVKNDCLNELIDIGIEDEHRLINYCIKTAYKSISRDKTLCWMLFGDDIVGNLKKNSPDNNFTIKIASKDDENAEEFLGKYYKLIEE